MSKIIVCLLLIITTSFAMSEVVSFNNNWGKNQLFNISSVTDAGIEVIFSVQQMVVEENIVDGVSMKTYGVPGIFLPNDEGAPNLAGTGRYIAIPQGATAKATIVNARTEIYKNIEVAPSPNIPLENDDSPLRYVKDMNIYSKNGYYPETPVKLSELMQIRGVDCVILGITPFQYNPVTKELIVYKDLRIRVDFVGGNGHFGDDALRNPYWETLLQGNLLNYSSLPRIDFYAPERMGRDGYEYIIIVPDDPIFIAWGDTIKNWRKLQGISTDVFTLTEIGGSTTTAIENFLNTAYNTWSPRPVAFLILSDYPSTGDVYGVTSPIWNSYCVSDNIYADVNGDDLPDMYYARICAQTSSQLNTMINKFLSYERNPYTSANFYNQPITATAWQTERWFQLCGEVIRGFLMDNTHGGLGKNPNRQCAIYSGTPTVDGAWSTASNTSTVVNYFYNRGWLSSLTNPYDATWWSNGSAANITAGINSGAFLLQHRDHGGETGWGEPAYSNSDINNLTNNQYVFVNSSNCLTGKYNWTSECFTEKFHRSQYGALGLNAASEVSYSFVNDAYVWGMYDCMWQQFMLDYPAADLPGHSNLRPCMAMNYGKYFLQASSWPYNTSDKTVTYHLFHHHGDAFNTLYSQIPQSLTVSHSPTLQAGQNSFSVTANDSSVVALTVNNEIIGVAMGTGSAVSIPITSQAAGNTMKVTVTKANYYRYMVSVPVVAASTPYIVTCKTVVSDSNANGQVNPGELINYTVWAKNAGGVSASGVYGKLSEIDPYMTIQIDSSWFGNIASGDSAISNPNYRFRFANNCPNNYLANFTVKFHDIYDSTWTSNLSVTVYAPDLTYQSVSVTGGDGNGILNRNETANLIVTIKNNGGAIASNIITRLRTSSPYITINDSLANFGTINPNNSANNNSDPYTVTASSSTPSGSNVQFLIIVVSGIYVDTLTFTLPVEIYLENFEASNGSYVANPSSSAWEWGVPTSGPNSAHSGTKVWATILAGNYTNNADWKLTSKEFVAGQNNPVLKFWHWYNMEKSSYYAGRAWDGGNVKISTDSGVTFSVIRPVGGYDGVGYTTTYGIANESCYTGPDTFWQQAEFILPVNNGQRFFLRWHFGSDANIAYPGWYIDDVSGYGFGVYDMVEIKDVGVDAIIYPIGTHQVNTALQPIARIKNYGNRTQTSFPVVCSIVGSGGAFRYTNTQYIASLSASDTMRVSFIAWTPTILEPCTVKIRTNLSGDQSPANDRRTNPFTVVDFTPPAIPSLVLPTNGFVTNNQTPQFIWRSVTDGDTYNLVVNTGKSVIDIRTHDTTYTPSTNLTEGNYLWKIRAKDAAGNWSNFTTERTFTIDITGPLAPALVLPANSSTISDPTPTFFWNSVADADLYNLTVNSGKSVIDISTTDTNYTPVTNLAQGDYLWKVRAQDATGNWGDYSSDWNFTLLNLNPGWSRKSDDPVPTRVPGKYVKDGGAMVAVPLATDENTSLYAFRGYKSNEFYLYDGTSWITMESIPFGRKPTDPYAYNKKKVGKGGALCFDGVNTIYAIKGNGTREFWAYDMTSNAWTSKGFAPPEKGLKGGTGIVFYNGKVYLLAGGRRAGETNFFAYDTTTRVWSTLNRALTTDGKLYKDGSCIVLLLDTIYALKGNGSDNYFYAYDIISNSWSARRTMPLVHPRISKNKKVKDGAAMTTDGSKIYAIKGGGINEFWTYQPGANSWTASDTIPRLNAKSVPKTGAALAYGGPEIYLLKGNNSTEFWQYIPTTVNSIQPLASSTNGAVQILNSQPSLQTTKIDIKPNPVTDQSKINFSLGHNSKVKISLYNCIGQIVNTILDQECSQGSYSLPLSSEGLTAGTYHIRFETDGNIKTIKIIVK